MHCWCARRWNQGVVATADGWLLSAQCDTKTHKGTTVRKGSSLLIFTSADGYAYTLKSSVPAQAPPGAAHCSSPGENTLVELAEGKGWLLVSRCGPGQQLLAWTSIDAKSWQRHTLPPLMRGVMPVAVRMDSGAIVLTTGRGGLAIWLNAEGDGKAWTLTNVGAAHNSLVLRNNKLNGSALQYTDAFVQYHVTHETTAYSTLRKLGPESGVMCYDRLSSSDAIPGPAKKPSWNGPPGNRDANDHMFCMRFKISVSEPKVEQ